MIAKAKLRYLRISPGKVNQVARLIRGKSVSYSLALLSHLRKRPAHSLLKLLNSALSNARNLGQTFQDLDNIYVSRLVVNQGPTLKRYRAAPFGRAVMIRKRTSHIELELDLRVK
ncbi:MAG TPA: 50S ribosomal protein L22 [Candidatus Omnitrophica bacterium]|nr:MAG: 50S ribosomal protein L22 [Candidatus Omnitrophota bacterium]RKY42721.1 MAG: 50S ribosomal protein L22 [Candidatus Omnitrophota bacterium]HEC69090.1 50S ribosomal protein L22 [Candidatus Omnitrophota bacterium]